MTEKKITSSFECSKMQTIVIGNGIMLMLFSYNL
jgi:hypothetical protein